MLQGTSYLAHPEMLDTKVRDIIAGGRNYNAQQGNGHLTRWEGSSGWRSGTDLTLTTMPSRKVSNHLPLLQGDLSIMF